MILALASYARNLLWQEWDNAYIVYQPSSAETHVFNGTVALILQLLAQACFPEEQLKARTEEALGLNEGELDDHGFAFAVHRLEALGLIVCLDETVIAQ